MPRSLVALTTLGAACGGGGAPTSPAPRAPHVETIAPAACAAAMQARFAIDTSADPRACVPLFEAVTSLGAELDDVIEGLAIVRVPRGPCGASCPDLAAQLMSDAALAYYQPHPRTLHLTDAAFGSPRWRGASTGDDVPGPAPSREQLDAYLAALGLDWTGLVARVRALPGAALPPDPLPPGDPRVLDAIVRSGPAAMMAGEPTVADLIRHELGHAIQLRSTAVRVRGFASVTGWSELDGDPIADGHIGGFYANERPIVASRILLGLPRGDGDYQPSGTGHPTPYARFDPMEDYGESVRLAFDDPRALGERSPIRLVLAAPADTLRDPALQRYLAPAARALLASTQGWYAMDVLRRKGDAMLPAIAPLADPRPLPVPADATAAEREELDHMQLVVRLGGLTFRPTDEAFAAMFAQNRADLRAMEELERTLDGLGK